MSKKHRDYPDNGYPSVTGVISQLTNYGLCEWFKRTPYQQILEESKRGKEIGTQMHSVIQEFIETGQAKIDTEYPDEITTALKSFQLFKKENPKFVLKASEMPLVSDTYKVNGTLDCIAEIDGVVWIGDWKSQNIKTADKPKAYSDYFTQVSSYVCMYNDIMKTDISNAVIVVLAKDKIAYHFEELDKGRILDEFNEVFLPLLRIWNYKQRSK